jgi:hypothetical protein
MMSGEQIASAIGLTLMLLVLIQRLVSREIASGAIIRMTVIWAAIILAAVAAVWLFQNYMHHNLT